MRTTVEFDLTDKKQRTALALVINALNAMDRPAEAVDAPMSPTTVADVIERRNGEEKADGDVPAVGHSNGAGRPIGSRGHYEPWTFAEVERMFHLREGGMRPREIAPLLGRKLNHVHNAMHRYRSLEDFRKRYGNKTGAIQNPDKPKRSISAPTTDGADHSEYAALFPYLDAGARPSEAIEKAGKTEKLDPRRLWGKYRAAHGFAGVTPYDRVHVKVSQ